MKKYYYACAILSIFVGKTNRDGGASCYPAMPLLNHHIYSVDTLSNELSKMFISQIPDLASRRAP